MEARTQFEWPAQDHTGRLQAFFTSPNDVSRFDWPFAMGVFGTLRQNCGNNRRMHAGKVTSVARAFLPHFKAEGLHVFYERDASAPFEVFEYEPAEWGRMIPGVDALESFCPIENFDNTNGNYYYRTLVKLRLLPDGFRHPLFPEGKPDLYSARNLGIAPDDWDGFDWVPAWVYSRVAHNRKVMEEFGDAAPILWWPGIR